ncbi:hypothetical protein EMIHUDRAFT_466754 [Emiliania huxleyi CCMP1516]|uniref:Uncharacterized protein n=2 Tax=Emiliania huxleyi TaxID=2903 RepID=A0A0D3KT18_EMIH1|nr:hypothetical protein EMIHUDRAFT_466754 [Emiliania huxleyi CCMP1516]EOD38903.1 hypothetical protein EMIHUDRAFT_466754 [Emiliania huxleyi CCMP1516]|eukprot:XP_005791332.1 hypothetical protein EMIHUDRAFT_466754 [Emiliania huxleyi CCMP1516]
MRPAPDYLPPRPATSRRADTAARKARRRVARGGRRDAAAAALSGGGRGLYTQDSIAAERASLEAERLSLLAEQMKLETALKRGDTLEDAPPPPLAPLAVPSVYYLSFTICSISGGGIVYQDFWRFTPLTAVGFVSGCLFCFSGVYLITKRGAPTLGDPYLCPPSLFTPPRCDPTLGDPYLCSPPRSNSAPGHGQRRAASYESPERLRELKSRRLPSRHPSRRGAEPRQLDFGGAAGGDGGDAALLGATFPRGAPHQLQRLTSGGMRRISTSISTLLDRDISVDLDATASLERGMSGHNPPPMARTWSPSVRRSAGGGFSAASIAEAAAAEAAAPATAGRSSSGGVLGGRGFGFRVSGLVGRPPDLL